MGAVGQGAGLGRSLNTLSFINIQFVFDFLIHMFSCILRVSGHIIDVKMFLSKNISGLRSSPQFPRSLLIDQFLRSFLIKFSNRSGLAPRAHPPRFLVYFRTRIRARLRGCTRVPIYTQYTNIKGDLPCTHTHVATHVCVHTYYENNAINVLYC